jgi:tetratricopeptide (TPR) repeat protein
MRRASHPPADPGQVHRLAQFINADTWSEKRHLAEQDVGLASEQTSELLEGWIGQTVSQGDAESADELRQYADFLTLMRTEGVTAAFEAVAETEAQVGDAALRRFYDSRTPGEARDALNEAIGSFSRALDATQLRHCPHWWNSAGLAHSERYDLAGDLEDLHLAVDLARRAVLDTEPGEAARARCLVNLAVYLLDRHDEGASDEDDLSEAEDAARQAVDEARKADDPAAVDYLTAAWVTKARAAKTRFDHAQERAPLEDAITAARAGLKVASTGPDRAAAASSLGSGLLSRYEFDGDAEDLDAAIAQYHRALESTTLLSSRPTPMSNLGIALLTRYSRSGDITDLDAAIDVLDHASQLTPPTASIAGRVSNNLGLVLAERYERRRDGNDLDRAVAAFRRAVKLTPARAVARPRTLLNLGGGLIDEYEGHHRRSCLEEAVDRLNEGLALVSPTSPEAAAFHNRLSVALRHRALHRRATVDRRADLDKAVNAARRAAELTATDSPLLPGWLDGLAAVLRARWFATGANQDRQEASEVSRRAAELGIQTDPATALQAALAWQSWTLSTSSWGEAAHATHLAVTALRALVSTQLLRGDKETWLRDAQGLTGRAALALARAGDIQSAVVAADTCRAVLLDEALQTGEANVDRLRTDGRIDLAIRLRRVLTRAQLEVSPTRRAGDEAERAGRSSSIPLEPDGLAVAVTAAGATPEKSDSGPEDNHPQNAEKMTPAAVYGDGDTAWKTPLFAEKFVTENWR